MRDIQSEIQDNLNAIEKEQNVTVLLAAESGSRAWGFASPDSDYDVRFIYLRPLEDYLRLDPPKDTICRQPDEVLDISGWDLKKALPAFGKGNASVMEWCASPIVYRQAPEWESVKTAVLKFFSEKAALYHYANTAFNTYREYLRGETVSYKKYFYALRPLLCCRWIERFHQPPPVEFSRLLQLFDGPDSDLSPELLTAVRDLWQRKAVTCEKDLRPQLPQISAFIKAECLRLQQSASAAPKNSPIDYGALNAVFRQTLHI